MRRFHKNGMMIIPNSIKEDIKDSKKVLVIKECYCPNGHSLVDKRAMFNEHYGIIVKVKNSEGEGLLALSPVYGDKTRVSLDLQLVEGDIYDYLCPVCDSSLPEFAPCTCGAELRALFNTKEADYANSIGVCNRVGCRNAVIKSEGKMISISKIETFGGMD